MTKPVVANMLELPRHTRHEGYLFVDHRASPGIPADHARRLGLDPAAVGEGKLLEAKTRTCVHCRRPVMLNPKRTRERGHCYQCNDYLCDVCASIASQPGYVHRSWSELVDAIVKGATDG